MKFIWAGLCFFLLPIWCFSQDACTIRIVGLNQFSLEKGCNPIRWPLSQSEIKLKEGQTFYEETVLLPLNQVVWMKVIADSIEKEFYLHANGEIELELNVDSSYWELKELKGNLNRQIELANEQINGFISAQPLRPGLPLPVRAVKLFADSLRKQTLNDWHPFARRYLEFRIAWLETSSRLVRYPAIFKDASKSRFDDVNNPACLDLIEIVFENYLNEYARTVQGRSVQQEIKVKKSYADLWVSLKGDSTLQNDTLRQWVLLKSLKDLTFSKDYPQDALYTIVAGLMESALTGDIKQEAGRMLSRWDFYARGKKVPSFKFKGLNEKEYELDQFKGKAIYLIYFPEVNDLIMRELKMLQTMSIRYENDLNIICLVGENSYNLESLFKLSSSKTFYLGRASTCDIIENERIFIEEYLKPSYYLIDAKLRFFKAPATGPETGVESSFLTLVKAGKD